MKSKISLILIPLFIGLCVLSCSDDDEPYKKRDQENNIKFKVYSNTPEALIVISEFYGGTLIIKDHWEGGYTTKQYGTQFSATCEDGTVLITGEIYVNGKLRLKRDGNKYIKLVVDNIKR